MTADSRDEPALVDLSTTLQPQERDWTGTQRNLSYCLLYTLVHQRCMTERPTTLVRLADALGVPIDALLDAEDRPTDRGASLDETLEIVSAFRQISDRQARRRCLNYVKSAAERSQST